MGRKRASHAASLVFKRLKQVPTKIILFHQGLKTTAKSVKFSGRGLYLSVRTLCLLKWWMFVCADKTVSKPRSNKINLGWYIQIFSLFCFDVCHLWRWTAIKKQSPCRLKIMSRFWTIPLLDDLEPNSKVLMELGCIFNYLHYYYVFTVNKASEMSCFFFTFASFWHLHQCWHINWRLLGGRDLLSSLWVLYYYFFNYFLKAYLLPLFPQNSGQFTKQREQHPSIKSEPPTKCSFSSMLAHICGRKWLLFIDLSSARHSLFSDMTYVICLEASFLHSTWDFGLLVKEKASLYMLRSRQWFY